MVQFASYFSSYKWPYCLLSVNLKQFLMQMDRTANTRTPTVNPRRRRSAVYDICRLQTADWRPQTAVDCRLQTSDCRLQTADCRLQTADCMRHIKVMFPTYVDRRKLGSCKSRNVGNIKTFIIPLLLTSSKYIYCFRFGSTLDKRK